MKDNTPKTVDDWFLDLFQGNYIPKVGESISNNQRVKESKQQLYQLIVDVIGDPESNPHGSSMSMGKTRRIIRNMLRAEQVTKLNKIFGVKNGNQ